MELKARKVLYLFGAVTAVSVLAVLVSGGIDLQVQVGADVDIKQANQALGNPVMRGFNSLAGFLVFLAVMATAGLVPGMLSKGRADYYLSKPISRSSLLATKLAAIWIVYGAAIVVSLLLTAVVMFVVHGLVGWNIVIVACFGLVSLFVWLTITLLAGILSGSGAVAIMSAFLVWIAQVALTGREIVSAFLDSRLVSTVLDVLYYVLPKTSQIESVADQVVAGGQVDSWMPLWSSVLFALAMLLVIHLDLQRKDY
ncbi:MAG: ABC transporter permease [Candidatus Zixiibacteriota bacterium]